MYLFVENSFSFSILAFPTVTVSEALVKVLDHQPGDEYVVIALFTFASKFIKSYQCTLSVVNKSLTAYICLEVGN